MHLFADMDNAGYRHCSENIGASLLRWTCRVNESWHKHVVRPRGMLAGWLKLLCLPLLIGLWPGVSGAASQTEQLPKMLRSVFLERTFRNTDLRDAKAVLEMSNQEFSQLLGLNVFSQVTIYKDVESLDAAIQKNELELVTLPALDYLDSREAPPVIPAFVTTYNNGQRLTFVLITRTDTGIYNLSELRDKA